MKSLDEISKDYDYDFDFDDIPINCSHSDLCIPSEKNGWKSGHLPRVFATAEVS